MSLANVLIRILLIASMLAFYISSRAGEQGDDSSKNPPQVLSLAELQSGSKPNLPVIHGASWQVGSLLKRVSGVDQKSDQPIIGELPASDLLVCDDPGFLVVSNCPRSAIRRLSEFVYRLGAVPFVPGACSRTVYVSTFESTSIVSGKGFPPTALSFVGESLTEVSPAVGVDGRILFQGEAMRIAEKLEFLGASVYILSVPGPWLTDEVQRPYPGRQRFVAWDDNLKQFPPLPYDDFGSEPAGFWIQKNIDSLGVFAGAVGDLGAASVPCPHYVLQFSLVNPTSGVPIVLTERMTLSANASDPSHFAVMYDVTPVEQFNGPLISCRRFNTRADILNATVGTNDRPRPGEDYLQASKEESLSFLQGLKRVLSQADGADVQVSPRLASMLGVLQRSGIDEDAPPEGGVEDIAGSPPGEYLSYLISLK